MSFNHLRNVVFSLENLPKPSKPYHASQASVLFFGFVLFLAMSREFSISVDVKNSQISAPKSRFIIKSQVNKNRWGTWVQACKTE